MLVPGYLLIFGVSHICDIKYQWNHSYLSYGVILFVVSYIMGLFIHYLSRFIFLWLRNPPILINIAYDAVYYKKEKFLIKRLREQYYEAYYNVAIHYPASALSNLEAQFSFLRSIVTIEFMCSLVEFCKFNVIIAIALSIISLILIIFMIYLQYKIHFRVWEDDLYITDNANWRLNIKNNKI